MDVSADVLQELRCGKCEVYLSRGPIYLQHDGAAACGRCFTAKNPATRNTQYEALARLARFPCKNRDLGCAVTVPFTEETQEIAHEEVCEYRQYVCPVLGSARCDWLGTRGEMLQHCHEQHPDRVLDNSCSLVHDITKSSLHNYLVTAFQLLFLLHTKVCVTTGKIFHAVRFLGDSEKVPEFNYLLKITRGDEMLSRKGQVVSQGCLAIQEDTSLALNTNSLLDMLGGGDGISFTLNLQRLESLVKSCIKCDAPVTVLEFRTKDGWICEKCMPDKQFCMYQDNGCDYWNFDEKCAKHEMNFCLQKTLCAICTSVIPQGTLFIHYNSAHRDVTYDSGAKWRITPQRDWQKAILHSVAATVICWYKVLKSEIDFQVHSKIPNEQLHEYKCTVRVMQPATGREKLFTPKAFYDTQYDWAVTVNKKHFPKWNQEFDVIVDILKTKS